MRRVFKLTSGFHANICAYITNEPNQHFSPVREEQVSGEPDGEPEQGAIPFPRHPEVCKVLQGHHKFSHFIFEAFPRIVNIRTVWNRQG
jgi:hypothetical protein